MDVGSIVVEEERRRRNDQRRPNGPNFLCVVSQNYEIWSKDARAAAGVKVKVG